MIEELNPAPLFDMTRYVREYTGEKTFMAEWNMFSSKTSPASKKLLGGAIV